MKMAGSATDSRESSFVQTCEPFASNAFGLSVRARPHAVHARGVCGCLEPCCIACKRDAPRSRPTGSARRQRAAGRVIHASPIRPPATTPSPSVDGVPAHRAAPFPQLGQHRARYRAHAARSAFERWPMLDLAAISSDAGDTRSTSISNASCSTGAPRRARCSAVASSIRRSTRSASATARSRHGVRLFYVSRYRDRVDCARLRAPRH